MKYDYFYNKSLRLWIAFQVDENNDRIEWDSEDNPIECLYFVNKTELLIFLKN